MPHQWREDDLWLRDWLQQTAADKSLGFVYITGHRKPLDVAASASKLLSNIENAVPFEVGDSIIRAVKFYATMNGFNKEQRIRKVTTSPDEDQLIDEAVSPPFPLNWQGKSTGRKSA